MDGRFALSPNIKAFLSSLAWSEGTDRPGLQVSHCHGYDVIVGGSLFTDFSRHPQKLVYIPKYKVHSTAAGRYQMIYPTWNVLRARLGLPDFSPESQDAACIELLRECGALPYIVAGKFAQGAQKARRIWASLPGSGNGQRENSVADVQDAYVRAGGVVA